MASKTILILGQLVREVISLLVLTVAVGLILVLVSYSPSDPGWNSSNVPQTISNIGGVEGAYIADIGFYLFGYMIFLVPACVVQFWWFSRRKWRTHSSGSIFQPIMFFIGFLLTLVGGCGLENLYGTYHTNHHYGGILGYEVIHAAQVHMQANSAVLLFIACCVIGTTAIGIIPWIRIFSFTGQTALQIFPSRSAIKADEEAEPELAEEARSNIPEPVPLQPIPVVPRNPVPENKITKKVKRKRKRKVKREPKVKVRKERKWNFRPKTEKSIPSVPKLPKKPRRSEYKKIVERKDPIIVPIWETNQEHTQHENRQSEPLQNDAFDPSPNQNSQPYTEQEFNEQDPYSSETEPSSSDNSIYSTEQSYGHPADSPQDSRTSRIYDYDDEETESSYDSTESSESPSFPNLSVLDPINDVDQAYSRQEISEIGQKIKSALADFKVSVDIRDAKIGPVITQFEIEPHPGIKANRVVNLASDLARTLTVQSVRVVDNIPGTPFVGIEVPNRQREIVQLVDGLASSEFLNATNPLSIVLGKDIRGHTVVTNLADMPHLLIAGTTGAGKSVCLNAILLSFLYKATAEDLRLMMIDPKMLEFSVYEGIPHLLAPVITDMRKTENALKWCIAEMERRYELIARLGVRNLQNYNDEIRRSKDPIQDLSAPDPEVAEPLKTLPYIVVIIDELSDLIMIMGRKAEDLIVRIAQKARAAGIHLIVATQRPSTDVIRGILKACIPTRISFKVASYVDSRTILDQAGAENLLGKGDMLFIPPLSATPVRVHGAFVSDDEVKRVVDSIKSVNSPQYDENVELALEGDDSANNDGGMHGALNQEDDELYQRAIEFVLRTRRPTISSVQRYLRVGYNRAARIIEAMEHAGVISEPGAGGKRKVLVPKDE